MAQVDEHEILTDIGLLQASPQTVESLYTFVFNNGKTYPKPEYHPWIRPPPPTEPYTDKMMYNNDACDKRSSNLHYRTEYMYQDNRIRFAPAVRGGSYMFFPGKLSKIPQGLNKHHSIQFTSVVPYAVYGLQFESIPFIKEKYGITKIRVAIQNKHGAWNDITNSNGMAMMFDLEGPSEGKVEFPTPVIAMAVRIYPMYWKGYPLLKAKLLVC
ncbi:PREDICTED: uncharacterized protein LOC106805721 [Priapulus caudatus]|uniref:Uncharacterized protein LOC106805721 n=1 Tax=Priapulus caudatus TaxID=37621 RepID=A0ABM1DSI9_PRICU|nr:PREDICTED: uncharacterized protein LOC106805721 [Priapulus caudatus]